jgi:hypothetical protein
MALPTQTITLELPEELYQSADQLARVTKRPLAELVANSLAHTLPPLDDVPAEEAESLASLSLLDDVGLWEVAAVVMSAEQQVEMHRLLDEQSNGELNEEEGAQLKKLMDEYGCLLVRKSHAWLLLARRGYNVPPQNS